MDVVITVKKFKRYLKTIGYAEKTIVIYSWCIDDFKTYLLSLNINDLRKVNYKLILDYQVKKSKEPIAMETKAVKIRVVKRLFEYLTKTNRLLINPTEEIVETNRQRRKIGNVLTVEEMETLILQPNLSIPSNIRDRAIIEVFYSTAIRSNELLSLHVHDVDLKEKTLFVSNGKGRRQRVVPFGNNAAKYLKEYIEKVRPKQVSRNLKERKLFLNAGGEPMTGNAIRAKMFRYRKQAGIEKPIGQQIFRRTCATHMLQEGADIRYIQKLLGHKYLRTTQQYTRIMPVDVKKVHMKSHPNTGRKDDDED